MSISAFGVEHGAVSKGFASMVRALRPGAKAAKGAKAAEPVKLAFKPIEKKPPMTGPGSMRGTMSPSAWETRTAANKPRGN